MFAGPASEKRFDSDSVADVHTPAQGGALPDFIDDSERLMPRNERVIRQFQMAAILFDIRAADAARFDAQDSFVRTDFRPIEFAEFDPFWTNLHRRANLARGSALPCHIVRDDDANLLGNDQIADA
jgi:hypothetical protein